MPSIQRIPRIRSNVRYVSTGYAEGYWELFCEDCVLEFRGGPIFWPLDTVFWDPRNMQRCRKCNKRKQARRIAQRRKDNPEFKAQQVAQSRAIRGY